MAETSSPGARSLPELPASSRYELLFKLASGGMASVYVGRLRGAGGFWRLVAIKKAHAHLTEDPSFRRMLVEEARLASRIHHPNVVPVLDVEQMDDHLLLVMDYIEGASLAELLSKRPGDPLPPRLAVRIALDACAGLAAAHDLKDPSGQSLHIVHRDVSPQNLLVGVDGVARLTDFGIAKSSSHGATTTTGALKGKLAYMAPEYVDGKPPDQRSDVFGLGVVIWEALANRRLFRGDSEVDTLRRVVEARAPVLSTVAPWVGTELDPVLAAALAKDPNERFTSAKALGNALEIAARRAELVGSAEEVGAHVRTLFEATLDERRQLIHRRVAADPTAVSMAATGDGGAAPPREGPAPPAQQSQAADAATARAGRRPLAATVIDAPDRDGSTLDGSGVSDAATGLSIAGVPRKSHRLIWALGAVALVVGGVAAFGVGRLESSGEPSAPTRDGPAPSMSAAPTVVVSAVTASPVVSSTPPAGVPSPSLAPSPSFSSTATAGSPRKPVQPKPSATASATSFTPPESIPANPYGTKP